MLIYSDRVLPCSISPRGFEPIAGRLQEIPQLDSVLDHEELSLGAANEIRGKAFWPFSRRNGLTNLALE